jgi:hypothetical protein
MHGATALAMRRRVEDRRAEHSGRAVVSLGGGSVLRVYCALRSRRPGASAAVPAPDLSGGGAPAGDAAGAKNLPMSLIDVCRYSILLVKKHCIAGAKPCHDQTLEFRANRRTADVGHRLAMVPPNMAVVALRRALAAAIALGAASAVDPACINPANEIVAENCLPGAPRWARTASAIPTGGHSAGRSALENMMTSRSSRRQPASQPASQSMPSCSDCIVYWLADPAVSLPQYRVGHQRCR